MKKAFIFDMDGVIIDTEPSWEKVKEEIFIKKFGKEIHEKIGMTVGININETYKKLRKLGVEISIEKYRKLFFTRAQKIYKSAPLSKNIDKLGNFLIMEDFVIGVVSASPRPWVDIALNRLSFVKNIKYVLSLDERDDIQHKPDPEGYNIAIKKLGSTPKQTIILEDSNAGIKSAKASGAFVIGLRENLVKGQTQKGADIYAEDLEEVIEIVKRFK